MGSKPRAQKTRRRQFRRVRSLKSKSLKDYSEPGSQYQPIESFLRPHITAIQENSGGWIPAILQTEASVRQPFPLWISPAPASTEDIGRPTRRSQGQPQQ